jgi:predicted short-subunit dehydrogenase-like oxidoreductase (DUF2520 family)
MTFAVVGGGRVTASFISRIPRLADELGAVAAHTYRLASRIVNQIGAGTPVRSFADLNDSPLILLCPPPSGLAGIVAALGESIECRGKTILLCEDGADSSQLCPLRFRGAAVGSIQTIPGFNGRRFVGEGDPDAVRKARTLVRKTGGRLDEVDSSKMPMYTAALSFGTSLFTPLLEASMQCFLDAGMTKTSAVKVVEALFQSSARAYAYAGKRSWAGPLARADLAAVQREINALAVSKPDLAEHYRQAVGSGLRVLGSPPALSSKTHG